MTRPAKLSVGMAHHQDFDGAYFTIQSLRLNEPDVRQHVELVVIDNSPGSPESETLRPLVEGNAAAGMAGCRWVEEREHTGTSATRDRIFREASGTAVLVLDCHVLLRPGTLGRLVEWYDRHPDTPDLYSGPLLWDHLRDCVTHYDDEWGAEMWGQWGAAWQCGCGPRGVRFSMADRGGRAAARALKLGFHPVTRCDRCERLVPTDLPYAGHERPLAQAGFRRLGLSDDDEPFEIAGMGLGLFSCRRDAWLGFNTHAEGFGGEELYVHEKFRRAGARAVCLPWLKWLHRFGRPGGPRYPLTLFNKVRNYVLEFQELGLDMTPLHKHFVVDGLVSQELWDKLVADPVGTRQPMPPAGPKPSCGSPTAAQQATPETLDALYERAERTPSDIYEHAPKLRELASQCDHVTEFGMRHGVSTVALLAGQPGRLVSYDLHRDPIAEQLAAVKGDCDFEFRQGNSLSVNIETTDLLFIDTRHTAEQLAAEMDRHAGQVRRWIALHDTQIFGDRGEDGSPGLLHALRPFVEAHPEWSVIYHTPRNHGFTVLSRLPEDRPAEPIHLWPPGHGPGTELRAIFAGMGITEKAGCQCVARAKQMDVWGVAGCRQHREQIIAWLKEDQDRWGFGEMFRAATKAFWSGLAFRLKPTDPIPGLVDEAIRRAEQGQERRAKSGEPEQPSGPPLSALGPPPARRAA